MSAVPKSFAQPENASSGTPGTLSVPVWPRLASGTVLATSTAAVRAAVPANEASPLCWTLTEGAAGMDSQVRGLASAVGYPTVHHRVALKWPFSTMWPGFVPCWDGIFRDPTLVAPEIPPRLVISCGRQAVIVSRALKRRFGSRVFTVHIQAPRLPTRLFDLIVTPAHDALVGPNVVHSLGAVHHVTTEKLRQAAARGPTAEMSVLQGTFVGVLLGGPNRYYGYHSADIERLIAQLRSLVEHDGVQLAIVPSRRTPAAVMDRLRREFGDRHFVWSGTGENPYLAILALASHLVVTGDSVSMVSEAAATCKPVHVFQLQERRTARRFRRFHQSFQNAGITRPFQGTLEHWTYASPDRTGLIATLIHEHLRE